MARPPASTQRSYAGNQRGHLKAALRHIHALMTLDTAYRGKPITSYPNQLAPTATVAQLSTAATALTALAAQLGPIPSR